MHAHRHTGYDTSNSQGERTCQIAANVPSSHSQRSTTHRGVAQEARCRCTPGPCIIFKRKNTATMLLRMSIGTHTQPRSPAKSQQLRNEQQPGWKGGTEWRDRQGCPTYRSAGGQTADRMWPAVVAARVGTVLPQMEGGWLGPPLTSVVIVIVPSTLQHTSISRRGHW